MLSAFPPQPSGYRNCCVPDKNRKHLIFLIFGKRSGYVTRVSWLEPQIPLGSMAGPGHWTLLSCLQCRPRTRLSTSFDEPRSPSLQRTLRRRYSLGQCGVPTSQPCFGCSMASLPLRSLKTQPGPRAFEIILLLTCTGSWPAWQVSGMAKGPPFSPVPTKSRVSEAGGRLILSTWVAWHRVGAWNAFAEWVKQGPRRAF